MAFFVFFPGTAGARVVAADCFFFLPGNFGRFGVARD